MRIVSNFLVLMMMVKWTGEIEVSKKSVRILVGLDAVVHIGLSFIVEQLMSCESVKVSLDIFC